MKNKHLLIGLLFSTLLLSCNENEEKAAEKLKSESEESIDQIQDTEQSKNSDKPSLTSISFEEDVHNFGTIKEGEKVEHSYTFTNTGKIELIISDTKASCGCTVPSYPKEPIQPGDNGQIDVVFDSSNKMGEVKKGITVIANTNPSKVVLYLEGTIKE